MLVQVFSVIKNYFEYEIITCLEIKSYLNIPKILIKTQPNDAKYEKIRNKLEATYPKFGRKYQSFYLNRYYLLYDFYILRTLTQKSEAEFHDLVIDPKQLINSYYFVINEKKFNCPKPDYTLEISLENQLFINVDYFDNWNESEKSKLINSGIGKDLEKIVFEPFRF
jgi:hypothetical protein